MSQHVSLEASRQRRRPWRRITAVAATAVVLPLSLIGTADAANSPAAGTGLTAVGPVNDLNQFPSWYKDSSGLRIEQCLDYTNPLCGFLPGDVPDETIPIAFPDNFPEEFFYQLVGAEVDFPGGGSAVLTSGLEAAFANGGPVPGDQMVFARVRIVVKGAPVAAGSTTTKLTFQHPFGTATVDVDGAGNGKYVQDIGVTPGDFTTAMKGNFGPFLRWTSGAPDGYVGNPDVPHAVTGGTNGNAFSTVAGGTAYTTDQFTISGKIATNTGVKADAAVVRTNADGKKYVDVYATTPGDNLVVTGTGLTSTPMLNDGDKHYARLLVSDAAPAEVTVVNKGDNPVSTSTVAVSNFTVTSATYDGTALKVVASGGTGLKVMGYGDLQADGTGSFTTPVAPLTVQVTNGPASVTYPVTVIDGSASPLGAPTAPPGTANGCPDPDAVLVDGQCTTPGSSNPPAATPVTATATAAQANLTRGTSTTLDGSGSTAGVTYAWSQVRGPEVTFSDKAAAKPTITALPVTFDATTTVPVLPAPSGGDALLRLTVTKGTETATADVTVKVVQDDLTVATARHVRNKELRIGGTSLYGGQAQVLTPQTWVYVWSVSSTGARSYLGRAQVDTLGAWELRQKPGPTAQVTSVEVQSTRGGYVASTTVATR